MGDSFKVQERTTTLRTGTLIESKGAFTVDITAADGRKIDGLDISGPNSTFETSGTHPITTFDFRAPSIVLFFDEEAEAAKAVGLPPIIYFTKGSLLETDFTEVGGSFVFKRIPRDAVSICTLLKPRRT